MEEHQVSFFLHLNLGPKEARKEQEIWQFRQIQKLTPHEEKNRRQKVK